MLLKCAWSAPLFHQVEEGSGMRGAGEGLRSTGKNRPGGVPAPPHTFTHLCPCFFPPPALMQAWQAADLGGDGKLDEREFCLFVQLLRGAQKGWPLPARLSGEEAAALLGEAPMPARPAQPPQLHIDAAHMRSVLHGQGQAAPGPAHSRQASQELEQSVIQVGHWGWMIESWQAADVMLM